MAAAGPRFFDVTASRGILDPGNPSQNPMLHSMFKRNEILAIKFETSQWVDKSMKTRWRFVVVGEFGNLFDTELSCEDDEGVWVREFGKTGPEFENPGVHKFYRFDKMHTEN